MLDNFGINTKTADRVVSEEEFEAFQSISEAVERDRAPFGPAVRKAVKKASLATLETIMSHNALSASIKHCSFLKEVQWFHKSI